MIDLSIMRKMTPSRHRWQSLFLILFSLIGMTSFCHAQNSTADPVRPLEADEVVRLEPTKIKELLVKTQDRIEVIPKLTSVLLSEIQLGQANDKRERAVKLTGRMRDEAQRAIVEKAVIQQMQFDSFWTTSDDEFIVSAAKVVITEPSTQMGLKNLSAGIEQFTAKRFDQADLLFTKAIVESPDRDEIHYWKVATAIALGQNDRAERRLEVLLKSDPRGSAAVAGKLGALQGPHRTAMIALEEKVSGRSK